MALLLITKKYRQFRPSPYPQEVEPGDVYDHLVRHYGAVPVDNFPEELASTVIVPAAEDDDMPLVEDALPEVTVPTETPATAADPVDPPQEEDASVAEGSPVEATEPAAEVGDGA